MIEYKSKFKVLWQFLNRNIAVLANKLRPYLFGYNGFTCTLVQTGTNDPIPTVLNNSLNVTAEFQRTGVGTYIVIFSREVFQSFNDYATITSGTKVGSTTVANVAQALPVFENVVEITTYIDGTLSDGIIGYNGVEGVPCIFEIRKYY